MAGIILLPFIKLNESVTGVLHPTPKVLQGCYRGVTPYPPKCYRGVTPYPQKCYGGVTGVLHPTPKSVTGVLQGCYT